MTSEPISWSRGHWLAWVFVVFTSQLALIFWLGDRKTFQPQAEANGPSLAMAGSVKSEVLALADPTLFGLPHQQGFSGPAWLNASQPSKQGLDSFVPESSAPPLVLNASGDDFSQFMATNQFDSFQHLSKPDPALSTAPQPSPVARSSKSILRQFEGLALRRLLSAVDLPSWPVRTNLTKEPDILTNTLVQLAVNADGRPVSVSLVSSSGLQDADKYALQQALALRFEPLGGSGGETLTNPLARLSWGQLSFDWLTVSGSTNEATPAP